MTTELVETTSLGEQSLAGFLKPVPVFVVGTLKLAHPPRLAAEPLPSPAAFPLTEREREVVSLIVRGYTNREIASDLIIAEGTAVRHVANILNKLGLKSRAQVAVWAVERAQSARA